MPEAPRPLDAEAELIAGAYNDAVADITALRDAIVGITAKLDADAGVSDTDYASLHDPAAQASESVQQGGTDV